MASESAYRCDDCGELFSDPDGPLYECSRCGGEQAGEDGNRCAECNVFMAKTAEECCPECQSPEIAELEAWRGADGILYESEGAEAEFLAQAPARATARQESEALFERISAEMHAAALVRNGRLLPRMRALVSALVDRAPRLRDTLAYAITCIERDPEDSGRVSATLYFEELAELFVPELAAEREVATNYRAGLDLREAAANLIRPRILAAVPVMLRERMEPGGWFTAGCGISFTVDEATDGLLEALGVAPEEA